MMLGSLSRARWIMLEPLLDAALELAPSERAGYLARACGADAKLRAEVEALLNACAMGDSILTDPASVTFAPLLGDVEERLPVLIGGRYRVVREIGRGGMGVVCLANDEKHGRQVAVKTLHYDVARVIGRERFVREIEIAAGLSHPHILPLHDSGELAPSDAGEPPRLYFITPFASGESLRARIAREGRLPVADAVRLAREIALALDYAHRRGVIHLDVKPENILLHEGHAMVADFGIARALPKPDDAPVARPILQLGTPAYMSPEQTLGTADVDCRSDVYSLGCVLFEMLTGERPSAQRPVDTAVLYERVSRDLASHVLRAMAPARNDRFATARDLADALVATGATRKRRRWALSLTVTASVVIAGGATMFWRSDRPATLDPDLVAVAPFDVTAPALAVWREGMVDVMSRSLDGAGSLRSVPASVVIHRWQGRGDARSAAALGVATGARLVLFGGLLSAGDSIRAAASLLDVETGQTLAELDARDVPSRVDRLADSLTRAVLRELGRVRRIDMAHATSSPTSSLAALKRYLHGERFYRAAQWDSAQAHFEHAVTLDSTFALAYHRLAAVRRWREPGARPDSIAYELMRMPSRFPRGLGPRERLLATIDSLSAETYFAWRRMARFGATGNETALFDRLCLTLVEAQRRHPNDPELAFLHAEVRSEYDRYVMPGEVDDRGTLERYDRAIQLDPGFAPAYVKPIALAAYLDGEESARRYTRAYLALTSAGPSSSFIRVADELLDPARSGTVDAAQLVATMAPAALCEALTILRHVPDSGETVVRIARVLASLQRSDPGALRRTYPCAAHEAVNGLRFRGRLREAETLAAFVGANADPTSLSYRARYGIESFDSAQPRGRPPAAGARRASSATADADLALARRDTAGALRLLLAVNDTRNECRYEHRVALVQLLAAAGRYREAGERLERRWPGTTSCSNGLDDIVWTMERARVFDRLGRSADAIASYELVVRAWRNADVELQPWVREARAAMTRLGGQVVM